MYDSNPSGLPQQSRPRPQAGQRPSQPGRPRSRAEARARAEKIRRRKRARLYFRIRQTILILLALAIGYWLGLHAGRAEAQANPTPNPAADQSQTQPPADPQPSQAPGDTTPPRIMGVNSMSVFVGSSIAYRSGILVTDDTDPAPKLTVDSFQVNLSAPGTYPVFYTAIDSAGNKTTLETSITVVEAPAAYVDEALIHEKADELLAGIITDGMTPEEQVNAVYDWIASHCYYIAQFDKSDYMQAAYLMMTDYRGDCYGFYAVSRLLFEELGLPNLTVTRLPNEVRTSNHWWNMVSLDCGGSWYHFDATPHLTAGARTCLVTDAYLEEFNQENPNYYYFDKTAVPRTPAA